jgi:hypothetical protein
MAYGEATTWGAATTGGSANHALAYCDGSVKEYVREVDTFLHDPKIALKALNSGSSGSAAN